MRIFLCGAQGVGKSTLVTSLPPEMGLEIKDSFSRQFLEKNPDIQNSSNIEYDEFQDKILLFCLTQYVNDKNFISSRSIIDSYAYLAACESKDQVILSNILNHYRDYVVTDQDIYIYLPIEFTISKGNNDMRNTDTEYQLRVDEQIRRYFKKLQERSKGASFYTVTGDRDSRLEQLIQIITKKREDVQN